MFSGYERISRAATREIAEALIAQRGALLLPNAGKRFVVWAAVRCWPELYGWTREGVLRAAAERLGVTLTYRGLHAGDRKTCGAIRTGRGDI